MGAKLMAGAPYRTSQPEVRRLQGVTISTSTEALPALKGSLSPHSQQIQGLDWPEESSA